MKKIFFSVVLVCLFCSCEKGNIRVGLILYNMEDPFVEEFAARIQEEAPDSFDLDVYDSQNSQIIQNEYIETLLKEDPDLVLLNPVDRLGAYPIIRKLKKENIPVIFFNREPLIKDMALWDRAYYVGALAEQSGQMQARLIMDYFGDDPDHLNGNDLNGDNAVQAVILKGEQGHQDAEIRTSEVIRSFNNAGYTLDLLEIAGANWNRSEAYEKTGEIFERYGDRLEAVLSNNDAMALGFIERMVDDNREINIPVVGIDGIDDAVRQIEAGRLYGTVLNDSAAQAKAIINLARRILEGYPPEDQYVWVNYQSFSLE